MFYGILKDFGSSVNLQSRIFLGQSVAIVLIVGKVMLINDHSKNLPISRRCFEFIAL